MDLLYTRNLNGFCIVSSDSDFTRLASRIRESGLVVYGFGEKKTPPSLINACDQFIFTEILVAASSATGKQPNLDDVDRKEERNKQSKAERTTKAKSGHTKDNAEPTNSLVQGKSPALLKKDQALLTLVKSAYDAVTGEDGWALLSTLGAQMIKLSPSFDPRGFGYNKLGELIMDTNMFEKKTIPGTKNPLAETWYIKIK